MPLMTGMAFLPVRDPSAIKKGAGNKQSCDTACSIAIAGIVDSQKHRPSGVAPHIIASFAKPIGVAGTVISLIETTIMRSSGRRQMNRKFHQPKGPMVSTKERLVQDLRAAQAPQRMIDLAEAGYYDDYLSEIATPIIQLVIDATHAGLSEIAEAAKSGQYDGTRQEADAWFQREGRHLFS